MANPYYDNTTTLLPGAVARTVDVEAKFNLVETGFDLVEDAIDLKAPLASPTFTGTVAVPVPSGGDDSTKPAPTSWVNDAIVTVGAAAVADATAQAVIATTQAGIATTQAGIATTQAGNASTSATNASTSAGTATTQAGIAITQAGIATTKAAEADASAIAAAASAASIAGGPVTSVNGNTGVVVLTAASVGAPTTTGTGANGTWDISITGTAASALQSPLDLSWNW